MSSRSFIVLAARHREGGSAPRLGITTSRRVGPAVVRSRVRRHVREWFRRSRSHLPAGRDLVVIARPSAAALSHRDVEEELGAAADRLHGAVAARERTR